MRSSCESRFKKQEFDRGHGRRGGRKDHHAGGVIDRCVGSGRQPDETNSRLGNSTQRLDKTASPICREVNDKYIKRLE